MGYIEEGDTTNSYYRSQQVKNMLQLEPRWLFHSVLPKININVYSCVSRPRRRTIVYAIGIRRTRNMTLVSMLQDAFMEN